MYGGGNRTDIFIFSTRGAATLTLIIETHANVIKLRSGVSRFLRIIMCKIEMRHRVFYY